MIVENVSNKSLLQGNNWFFAGVVTLAAGATLPAGAVLKRGVGNLAFAAAVSSDEYTAVNPTEIKNESAVSRELGFRALVAGRVREDMLTVNGAALAAADVDKLRKVGILPVRMTDMSMLDNQ